MDGDFAWMLGGPPRTDGLRLPPGGVDAPDILRVVRDLFATWMVVEDGEIVGLCSYKGAMTAEGEIEIGYGVAASRRGLGHATRAVAAMLELAAADPAVTALVAQTADDNIASQIPLRRNGFVEIGRQFDPQDGRLIHWRAPVKSAPAARLK